MSQEHAHAVQASTHHQTSPRGPPRAGLYPKKSVLFGRDGARDEAGHFKYPGLRGRADPGSSRCQRRDALRGRDELPVASFLAAFCARNATIGLTRILGRT